MLLRLFGVLAIIFTGSAAYSFRCSTAQSFTNQCPSLMAGIGERFKSVSGVCGDGSSVSYSTSNSRACMSKAQLESLLNRQCEMSRRCGLLPKPSPEPLPKPIPIPQPLPSPQPGSPPPPIQQPPNVPPITMPSEPSHPIDLPIVPPKPSPTPLPVDPPPQPLPKPPPVTLPPVNPGEPVSSNFKGAYVSAVAASNLVTVKWSTSELSGNLCGTGTVYSRSAILDKNDSRNAVFFEKYPAASGQYMSVTLVCAGAPEKSGPVVLTNEFTLSSVVTINYSPAASYCYVSAFTEAASPPRCMLP